EFLPTRGGAITRLEILDGEPLYAIEITPPADHGFNLCPADICQSDATPEPASFEACPTRPSMAIAAASPARAEIEAGLRIAEAARLGGGGVGDLVELWSGQSF